jgi:AraC family transcriptional regulator
MEWLERLNKSVDYIEQNLGDIISYRQAAQIACCSTYHYQRMFSYIAGIPLSEYIRRRRMTVAAFELQNNDVKVIDVALKYGYDSPTSFNRAFQSVHGVSPSRVRKDGISLKAFPRIIFNISIKGDAEMNYKIEKKDNIRIVGVKEHFKMDIEESFAKVPLFWQKTIESGMIPELCSLLNQPPYGLLGVSACMDGEDFDYYIAVATDKPAPGGTFEYTIPAATWAVFECVGAMPQSIQELQKRIVSEWLPMSGYEYANAPDIEVYPEGDQFSSGYRCEVWLPVIKKQ